MRLSLTISNKEIYDKIGLKHVIERKIPLLQYEILKREEIIETYLQVIFKTNLYI